jgi:hypothetical protein
MPVYTVPSSRDCDRIPQRELSGDVHAFKRVKCQGQTLSRLTRLDVDVERASTR